MGLRVKDSLKIPLLVKIQNVDVDKLDFKSSVAKNKLVTYVEGTSRFLFVGCTTGTVYVFSRESHKFLFIIPFKGGKVCGIACAEDESDVAVGSLRGNVTIYRLKNVDNGEANNVQVVVKPLYTVTHHRNNEITEMQWSPNGRYIFIGDTQGIISQVDVGSLEEFPRPPPSRIILQVQSRILQLNCLFPYLAVNTLAGVFLCDIENEDFTRIYSSDRRTIVKATGVCLVTSPDLQTDEYQSASLYVACQNSGSILRYGVQGNLISTHDISSSMVFPQEVPLFDPKKQIELYKTEDRAGDFKTSFGKLYSSDEGFIISASHHRITIMEPTSSGLKLVLWNDDFRRISSFKVLSNYLFVWETSKLNVVALTHFQTYGVQLLRANLGPVLENWIRHALNSVGWKEEMEESDDDDEDMKTRKRQCVQLLVSVMGLSAYSEQTEFLEFITSHVPASITESLKNALKSIQDEDFSEDSATETVAEEEETTLVPNPTQISLKKLSSALQEISQALQSNAIDTQCAFRLCWKVMKDFYSEIDAQLPQNVDNSDEDSVLFKQSLFQSKMTLENLIQSATGFLKQSVFLSVSSELNEMCLEKEVIRESLNILISSFALTTDSELFVEEEEDEEAEKEDGAGTASLLFLKYSRQNFVSRWLKDFSVSQKDIQADASISEILLLLLPIYYWTESRDVVQLLRMYRQRVFSWLAVLVSSKVYNKFPFHPKISEFLVCKVQGSVISEVISSVYEDFLNCDDESYGAANFLHHFASILHFKSSTKNSKSKIIAALITHFPLKNRSDGEVREIARRLCQDNPMLVKMYKEACLTDGSSQVLCKCGLPEFYGLPRLFMIAKTQRILEEVILNLLMNSPESRDAKSALKFAMKRLLLDKYFEIIMERSDGSASCSDRINVEIVFRTGQCHLLHRYIPFSRECLSTCLELYNRLYEDSKGREKCLTCGQSLKTLPNFRPISWDCLGAWVMGDNKMDNIQHLLDILSFTPKLNLPGVFTLRLYRHLVPNFIAAAEAFEEESIDYETISRSRFNSNSNSSRFNQCIAFRK